MRTTTKMGLASWDQAPDPYQYAQLAANWSILDFHDHTPGRGVPIAAGGIAPGAVLAQSIAAGVVGTQHLSAALAQSASVNTSLQVVKGLCVNMTTGTRTNAAFGALNDAADAVPSIVLPANGVIVVLFQGIWQESVASAASATITLNGVPVKRATANAAVAQTAVIGGTVNKDVPITTFGGGLGSFAGGSGYSGDVTTGQIIGLSDGGPAYLLAAAGTYTVGVQYAASSGTVTVKNRRLFVQTLSYV